MEKASKFGILGIQIIDEFHLHRLHGGHGENGLGQSGAQPAKHPHVWRQIPIRIRRMSFQILERTKSLNNSQFIPNKIKNMEDLAYDKNQRKNISIFACHLTADFGIDP